MLNRFWSKINSIFDHGIRALFYAAAVLLFACFLAICIEVIMRFGFNSPQIWTNEFCEYTMLYATYLGAAWILKEEGHVKVEIVLDYLKPRANALTNAVTSILGALVCLVLVIYGTRSTIVHYQEGLTTFTALQLLKWPFLLIIPLGSFFLFIQFIRRFNGYLKKSKQTDNIRRQS